MTEPYTPNTAQQQEQNSNSFTAGTPASEPAAVVQTPPAVPQTPSAAPEPVADVTSTTTTQVQTSSTQQVATEAVQSSEPKVLIVEDERPLAHALELKLNHSGMKATAVNSGNDALAQIENTTFDIILLDLILPGMDGFELLQEIRKRNESVKIVILSNLGQSEDRDRIEPFNVAEYYVKSNMPLAAVVESIQSLTSPNLT